MGRPLASFKRTKLGNEADHGESLDREFKRELSKMRAKRRGSHSKEEGQTQSNASDLQVAESIYEEES